MVTADGYSASTLSNRADAVVGDVFASLHVFLLFDLQVNERLCVKLAEIRKFHEAHQNELVGLEPALVRKPGRSRIAEAQEADINRSAGAARAAFNQGPWPRCLMVNGLSTCSPLRARFPIVRKILV